MLTTTGNIEQSSVDFKADVDKILTETNKLLSINPSLKVVGFGSVKNNFKIGSLNENQAMLRSRANKLATTVSFNESKSGFSELKKLLKAD